MIAAFVLFGAFLLNTGGGQTFMDLAMRLGGKSPGGAAKMATIASGLFGMVSGSAVANVATTGNFTIPLMKRLNYPAPFAAAVEAVASTGGQLAPPIMGAAAFVMAEILGISYVDVMVAAILPALFFYLSVFMTVHVVSVRRNMRIVDETEIPAWATIVKWRRVLPICAALGGLFFGIFDGRSVQTAAFYGIAGLFVAYLAVSLGQVPLRQMGRQLVASLDDAGRGLVIIGVLLAGAQILVAMINLTGIGVTLSSLIVAIAGNSTVLIAIIVGVVCLIIGMGLPTTAAYVLVAAVLAPALTSVGVEPLAAHMFVFYFATISVITPPVCVAVFVAAGIAQTNWLPAAREAVRLGAMTYVVPFLLLLYPGMIGEGGAMAVLDAVMTGLVLTIAIPCLLGRMPLFGQRFVDIAIYLAVIALAFVPVIGLPIIAAPYPGGRLLSRRAEGAADGGHLQRGGRASALAAGGGASMSELRSPIKKVAVVGTGLIGAGWTTVFLANGLDVVAIDPAPDASDRLRRDVATMWAAPGGTGAGRGAAGFQRPDLRRRARDRTRRCRSRPGERAGTARPKACAVRRDRALRAGRCHPGVLDLRAFDRRRSDRLRPSAALRRRPSVQPAASPAAGRGLRRSADRPCRGRPRHGVLRVPREGAGAAEEGDPGSHRRASQRRALSGGGSSRRRGRRVGRRHRCRRAQRSGAQMGDDRAAHDLSPRRRRRRNPPLSRPSRRQSAAALGRSR